MNDGNAIFFQVLLEYHVAPILHWWKSLSKFIFDMIGYHLVIPSEKEEIIANFEMTNIHFKYIFNIIPRKFIKYVDYLINVHITLHPPSSPKKRKTFYYCTWFISLQGSHPHELGPIQIDDEYIWNLMNVMMIGHYRTFMCYHTFTRACDVTSGSISFL